MIDLLAPAANDRYPPILPISPFLQPDPIPQSREFQLLLGAVAQVFETVSHHLRLGEGEAPQVGQG